MSMYTKPTTKAVDRQITPGITNVVCPKCGEFVKSYPTWVTTLNEWAFKRVGGTMVTTRFDGRGCCF